MTFIQLKKVALADAVFVALFALASHFILQGIFEGSKKGDKR